jgi:hypothetical protein
MTYTSIAREKKILEILQQRGSASIQELAEAISVSNMTIHRDLNRMAETGQIQKKHGGATLAGKSAVSGRQACAMCSKSVPERTIFIVQPENREQKLACCAHCGLMLQGQSKNAWQSLTTDYLHGHMVSANQATYLYGSEINICCVPSVLSFGSQAEAKKFQKGFGGTLASMDETLQYLHGMAHAH